ncbi:hypothetical protein V6N12_054764 [Hibiscus sabdariffa]|uniref:Cytochrome P450 n=1 Tax=Hibiscus sabdariffa TaxID=183260 RepID=A0ABR2D1F0_9ROSI
MPLSDDIEPYVTLFYHQVLEKYEGCSEIDVWPYLVNMTRDVISQATFGNSSKEDILLVESNIREIKANADRKIMGMSIEDDLLLARSTCGFLGDRVEGRSKVVLVNSENRFHLSNTIELDEGGVVSLSNTKPVEEQKRRRKKQRATAQVSHFNARFKEQEEESSGKRKQHAKALGDGGRLNFWALSSRVFGDWNSNEAKDEMNKPLSREEIKAEGTIGAINILNLQTADLSHTQRKRKDMEADLVIIRDLLCFLVAGLLMIWGWRVLNWAWLTPKRLERCLRQQGLKGTPYMSLSGDIKQMFAMTRQTTATPMPLSDDIEPYVTPFLHQVLQKYGKDSFVWIGPCPRVNIVEPEKLREIFTKFTDFQKVHSNPLFDLLINGLSSLEGDNWSKHRKIINPAFHQDKLKNMSPAFYQSCSDMISKWENMVSKEGCSEIDVWPYLVNMTRDSVYIPGWRFVPTKTNRELKMKYNDIKESLRGMIKRREKAIKEGEESNEDLLDILVDSNIRAIEANVDRKNMGMSIEDVIEECKLFYFAGQETTLVLLVWTMILLARYPDWQTKARDEVVQVFGDNKLDADGLNRLKVVTMILYEVLRLYPAVVELVRSVPKDLKLGKLLLPARIEISIPMLQIHRDKELWGEDANEFKPERFVEGVSNATKSQMAFLPFGWGPRICIGQNFAMMEAKMAMAMILKRFWFELSPAYAHSPYIFATVRPQHGAQIILHHLGSD